MLAMTSLSRNMYVLYPCYLYLPVDLYSHYGSMLWISLELGAKVLPGGVLHIGREQTYVLSA